MARLTSDLSFLVGVVGSDLASLAAASLSIRFCLVGDRDGLGGIGAKSLRTVLVGIKREVGLVIPSPILLVPPSNFSERGGDCTLACLVNMPLLTGDFGENGSEVFFMLDGLGDFSTSDTEAVSGA